MVYIQEDSSAPYGMVVRDKEHDKLYLLDKSVKGSNEEKVEFPSWVPHRMAKRDKLRDSFDRAVVALGESYNAELGVDLETLDIWQGTKNNPKSGESATSSTRSNSMTKFTSMENACNLVETVLANATEEELKEADLDTDIIASVMTLARTVIAREKDTAEKEERAKKEETAKSNMGGLKELGWSKEQLLALVNGLFETEATTEATTEDSKE